ncbi:hypothetical protein BXZ70DRAFT_1006192 [Cristinia sonorae]|uniref:F-box domain-containing protein n=1 Tax=Cristinia sonorae TaxID=1940300 RepID=A0A8K0USQ3_9AGAR|nr:hypothetical protein BXZ70DRAFT_1006192 [Cristinia sonorae]
MPARYRSHRSHWHKHHCPLLPTEICEMVIDYIAASKGDANRTGTLMACAQVCRAWYSRSRSHLLDKICIRDLETVEQVNDFFLKTHPKLKCCVRGLCIYQPSRTNLSHQGTQTTTASCITPILLRMAPIFRQLKTVTLVRLELSNAHPKFSPALTLLESVEDLTIRSSTCDHPRTLSRIINAIPTLTSLSLIDLRFSKQEPTFMVPRRSSHCLPHFKLEFKDMHVHQICDALNYLRFSSTQRLTVSIWIVQPHDNSWETNAQLAESVRAFQANHSGIKSVVVKLRFVTPSNKVDLELIRCLDQNGGIQRIVRLHCYRDAMGCFGSVWDVGFIPILLATFCPYEVDALRVTIYGACGSAGVAAALSEDALYKISAVWQNVERTRISWKESRIDVVDYRGHVRVWAVRRTFSSSQVADRGSLVARSTLWTTRLLPARREPDSRNVTMCSDPAMSCVIPKIYPTFLTEWRLSVAPSVAAEYKST